MHRIDVPTALTHDYVAPYHDPMDEPSCPEIFSKWEEVESLETIPELREAITREITEFREEVRSIPMSDDEDEESEEDEMDSIVQMGDVSTSPIVATSPLASTVHGVSPRSTGQPDLGISPRSSAVPLPRQAEPSSSPLSTRLPLSRATSRDRERPRGRDSAPNTPGLSTLSEDSFSAAPMTGRASRRSSGHSMTFAPGRRPASYLFSNPLGGGMTPMNVSSSLPTGTPALAQVANAGGVGAHSDGWARPRSRAPSSTGEFARPLIRQLSTVGLDALGRPSEGTAIESGFTGEVPPMSVSPSDAPPSEVCEALRLTWMSC